MILDEENIVPSNESLDKDDLNWGMLAHLAGFAGFMIPLGNIIGPLVVYLIYRDKSTYVANHGKEALNFQISIMIYFIVSFILCFVFVGFVLLAVVGILQLVYTIIAAVDASKGKNYSYPLTFRFIS